MPRSALSPVTIVGGQLEGAQANAFRVVDQPGAECLLDFLSYDETTKTAEVVIRVRVRREFLPAIRDHLNRTITPLPATAITLWRPLESSPSN